MAAVEAIRAEYELNKKANEAVPGSVSKQQVEGLLLKRKEADLAVEKARRDQRIAEKEAKVAKAELDRAKHRAAEERTAPAAPGEKGEKNRLKPGLPVLNPLPPKKNPLSSKGP